MEAALRENRFVLSSGDDSLTIPVVFEKIFFFTQRPNQDVYERIKLLAKAVNPKVAIFEYITITNDLLKDNDHMKDNSPKLVLIDDFLNAHKNIAGIIQSWVTQDWRNKNASTMFAYQKYHGQENLAPRANSAYMYFWFSTSVARNAKLLLTNMFPPNEVEHLLMYLQKKHAIYDYKFLVIDKRPALGKAIVYDTEMKLWNFTE